MLKPRAATLCGAGIFASGMLGVGAILFATRSDNDWMTDGSLCRPAVDAEQTAEFQVAERVDHALFQLDDFESADSVASGEPDDGVVTPVIPEKLAAPHGAAPIGENYTEIRAIIDAALPHAPPEERDVWFEELREFPVEVAREILRIRSRFGGQSLVTAPAEQSVPRAPLVAPPSIVTNVPLELEPGHDQVIRPTIAALERAQAVVLHNIANAGSVAFKRRRCIFTDGSYLNLERSGVSAAPNTASELAVGMGARLIAAQIQFEQGRLKATGRPLDIAIEGCGFLGVKIQFEEEILYTRGGALEVNSDGNLVAVIGGAERLIDPAIQIPNDTMEIAIFRDGIVSVKQPGSTNRTQLGQIQLINFTNPLGLEPRGDGLFAQTEASSFPQQSPPNQGGAGIIRQGFLEESNVSLTDELAELRRLQQHANALRQARAILQNTEIAQP